jgi:uncharacterized membrane protein
MVLSETGKSRVNGYLYVLERSLQSFLPRETATDAVREIESHLRERIAARTATPDERTTLEGIFAELGPPLRVAQAYASERVLDEAVTTGRLVATLGAVWHLATTTVIGFVAALGIFIGYVAAFAFVAIAVLKPIFPDNVGVEFVQGVPVAFGAHFPTAVGADLRGGYWVIPMALFGGLAIFVGTHRGARRFLAWMRERRVPGPAALSPLIK